MSVLLTTPAAAKILGLRPQTLRKMRMRGDGPPFVRLSERTGRFYKVRYNRDDVERWRDERLDGKRRLSGV